MAESNHFMVSADIQHVSISYWEWGAPIMMDLFCSSFLVLYITVSYHQLNNSATYEKIGYCLNDRWVKHDFYFSLISKRRKQYFNNYMFVVYWVEINVLCIIYRIIILSDSYWVNLHNYHFRKKVILIVT